MFLELDALRRMRGRMLDSFGLGPEETPFTIVAEQPGVRLRAYGSGDREPRGPAVLIIPAPFKRSYIWDLRPEVSVVRRCQEGGLAVFLAEWRDPQPGEDFGLADYAEALPKAAAEAIAETGAETPVILAGHSLGGTFAVIFAALHPHLVRDLWLVDAPLFFGLSSGDRIAALLRTIDLDRLVAAVGHPIAGSVVSGLAMAALPDEFVWRPVADLLASGWDVERQRLRAQVLRWAHDEFPLSQRLFSEVAGQLYRDDCLARGALRIGQRDVGLSDLRTPIAAVLNPASAVVPAHAISRGLALVRAAPVTTFVHEASPGCAIPHMGPLVSPEAHARIWPRLVARAREPWPE